MIQPLFRATRTRSCIVVALGSALLAAACGDDQEAATGTCTRAGYIEGQFARDLCGCEHASVKCSSAGASVTRANCICAAERGGCSADVEGLVFCGAKQTGYQCKNGTFSTLLQCPGTGSCLGNGTNDRVTCGSASNHIDYAVEGEPCASEQAAACTVDQTKVLACQRGIWTMGKACSSGASRCERVFQGDPGVNCPGGKTACLGCGSF